MSFVCCRNRYEFIVGATQENWFEVPAIREIRKEDREHRLGAYAQLAENAYRELRRIGTTLDEPKVRFSKQGPPILFDAYSGHFVG